MDTTRILTTLGLDNSEFNDTYSVGFGYETYIGDVVLSLGGGFEKAISDTDTEANCLTTDLSTADDAHLLMSFLMVYMVQVDVVTKLYQR